MKNLALILFLSLLLCFSVSTVSFSSELVYMSSNVKILGGSWRDEGNGINSAIMESEDGEQYRGYFLVDKNGEITMYAAVRDPSYEGKPILIPEDIIIGENDNEGILLQVGYDD